jgi:hypothetical protein
MGFSDREKVLLVLVVLLALYVLYYEDKKRKQQTKENLSISEMLKTPLKDITFK